MSQKRKIIQLDMETGEALKEFESIKDVSVEYGLYLPTLYNYMCKGTAIIKKKNLRFEYAEKQTSKNIYGRKKIRQLDYYTGEEIDVYDTCLECANDNYVSTGHIRYCIKKNNGKMRFKRLRFEYVE